MMCLPECLCAESLFFSFLVQFCNLFSLVVTILNIGHPPLFVLGHLVTKLKWFLVRPVCLSNARPPPLPVFKLPVLCCIAMRSSFQSFGPSKQNFMTISLLLLLLSAVSQGILWSSAG